MTGSKPPQAVVFITAARVTYSQSYTRPHTIIAAAQD